MATALHSSQGHGSAKVLRQSKPKITRNPAKELYYYLYVSLNNTISQTNIQIRMVRGRNICLIYAF